MKPGEKACPYLGTMGLSALYLYLMSLTPVSNTVLKPSSSHLKTKKLRWKERVISSKVSGCQVAMMGYMDALSDSATFCLFPTLPDVVCLLIPLFPVSLFISLHLWLLVLLQGRQEWGGSLRSSGD